MRGACATDPQRTHQADPWLQQVPGSATRVPLQRATAASTGQPIESLGNQQQPYKGINDVPPLWDGQNPESQLEPYLKKLHLWLATTRTLKNLRGMTLLTYAQGDLRLLIGELDVDTLTSESSGQVVFEYVKTNYADHLDKIWTYWIQGAHETLRKMDRRCSETAKCCESFPFMEDTRKHLSVTGHRRNYSHKKTLLSSKVRYSSGILPRVKRKFKDHSGHCGFSSCLRVCDQTDSLLKSSSTVVYSGQSSLTTLLANGEVKTFLGLTVTRGRALVDTGAQHAVVGNVQYAEIEKALATYNLKPRVVPTLAMEAMGVGGSSSFIRSAEIPTGIGGISGLLTMHVLPGEVPPLLPVEFCRKMKANMDF